MIQQQVFQKHQFDMLRALLEKFDTSKVLLVRAGKSYRLSGAEAFIQKFFQDNSLTSFKEFDPNPQLDDLKKGIELFKSGKFEQIIAIGGGSVLDMGKLISMFAHQSACFKDIIEGRAKLNPVKTSLLAIPTTAGSGAEATRFAVVYIGKQKYSVAHELMLPDYVYLDAAFSFSATDYLTACTGLDALSQAMESVWSVNADAQSQEYALEAIRLIWANLKKAVHQYDEVAKGNMQQAAYLAGKAINITKTTAPHALSYAFTSFYGIPHGHAVALSLPFFLDFNYYLDDNNCIDPRGAAAVKLRIAKIFDLMKVNGGEAQVELSQFIQSMGVNLNPHTLIKNFDPQLIIENVNIERLSNNPRKVNKNEIANFLKV